jgi:ribosomal protein S18 acetylase RimI-like enzyme
MTPIERNCANLRHALSFYGPPVARDGVALIASRVTYSVFNIALLDTPAGAAPGDFELRVRAARDYFENDGRQWSFWVCEDWLPLKQQRRLYETFAGFGMHCIAESPGMEIAALPAPARSLPELVYLPVETEATREAFTRLIAQCFYVPIRIAEEVYRGPGAWDGPLRAWLGYVDGQPVTAAATAIAAGALGVYSVATAPAYRRRGLAEAIMRHAIAQARPQCPDGPIVLQSSSFGLALYRRLGFRRTTRFFVFANP